MTPLSQHSTMACSGKASGSRTKHQLPLRPAFIPMHGNKSGKASEHAAATQAGERCGAPCHSTRAQQQQQQGRVANRSRPLGNDAVPVSRRSRHLLQGRRCDAECSLTWQQREMLESQSSQPTMLEPIVISLDGVEHARRGRQSSQQPAPLRLHMTRYGPQMSLHLSGHGATTTVAVPLPIASKGLAEVSSSESISDLPTWYHPATDGPLYVVYGADVREGSRPAASTSSRLDAEQRCHSPALSSSSSLPHLDSPSSSCSSVCDFDPTSPEPHHATLANQLPDRTVAFSTALHAQNYYHYCGTPKKTSNPTNDHSDSYSNHTVGLSYAGPNFCKAPLPHRLPAPAFRSHSRGRGRA